MYKTQCSNLQAVAQFASNLTAKICSMLATWTLSDLVLQQP